MILTGHQDPLRRLLVGSPPLAARFSAVTGFPGYTPAQLAAIFASLAVEAGFALTPAAASTAATVLARAGGHSRGSARLAVRLLDQATADQARRITAPHPPEPAAPGTILPAGIPGQLHTPDLPDDHEWPGLYL